MFIGNPSIERQREERQRYREKPMKHPERNLRLIFGRSPKCACDVAAVFVLPFNLLTASDSTLSATLSPQEDCWQTPKAVLRVSGT